MPARDSGGKRPPRQKPSKEEKERKEKEREEKLRDKVRKSCDALPVELLKSLVVPALNTATTHLKQKKKLEKEKAELSSKKSESSSKRKPRKRKVVELTDSPAGSAA
eukprot:gene958-483_t